MKKKLICLILSLVMLTACFAGCGAKDDEARNESINQTQFEMAKTLSMYMLCEKPVSAEQELALEDAINSITKSKFKTAVDLRFYTADEYYVQLEKSFADRDAAAEAGTLKKEEELTEDITYVDEYGITQIKYPTVEGYQVDIFYVGGQEKFLKYMDEGRLSRLDEELSSSSKILNDYISPEYLKYMKNSNNGTYAIVNNDVIGEYTYLLLNKDILAKTRYNTPNGLKEFTSLTCEATQSVLEQVKSEYKEYVPLYSCLGADGIAATGVRYWGIDENGNLSDDFSLLMGSYNVGSKYKTVESFISMMNGLGSSRFKDQLKILKSYKANGYFGTEKDLEDGKAAVAYVKGGAEMFDKYGEDYEVVVIENPTIKTADLYENMFAVSSTAQDLSRAMEIICLLNTDEELRNLFQYGIEGVNYEMVDSDYLDENEKPYKVVRRLNEDYMMDPAKTGNTLLTYTLEGGNPTFKEYIKQQNRDVVVDIAMGFSLMYGSNPVNMDTMQTIREVSKTVYDKLVAITYDNFDEQYSAIASEFGQNEDVRSMLSMLEPDGEDTPVSFTYMYVEWAKSVGIYVEEEEL